MLLFGSLATGGRFHIRSDIDLAVEGLRPEDYWRADCRLEAVGGDTQIDLFDLGTAQPELVRAIRGDGKKRALAQRIRRELSDLQHAVAAVGRHWERSQHEASDQDAFLNSVALNLHGFYNGIERVMELIAVEIDGAALGGDAWHRELLDQMQIEIPSVRPSVITAETRAQLDEYRRFRHRVRNIYAADLRPPQLEPLVIHLSSTCALLQRELLAFLDSLETDG